MHFVMVQRMLRGIQERAMVQPLVPGGVLIVARIGWLLAGAGVLGLLLSRRHRWPWLALAVLVLVPALLASGDWDAALAGFLAIGIALSGFLAFGRGWWPAYLLITSLVLLVLLVAPDAYTAFGLVFDLIGIVSLAGAVRRLSSLQARNDMQRIDYESFSSSAR